MKIPKFYDMRWEDQPALQTCRKDYEKSKEKLDYLRTEYELWALWIDKFYNGKYGIFKIKGDAPRYVLEYDMDFCDWEKTYKKNYSKRDHLGNHKVRAKYIIKILKELFNDVANYDLNITDDEDEEFNLDLEEMKENMNNDSTYKQKWFKAAKDANEYINKLILKKNQTKRTVKSKKVSRKRKQSQRKRKSLSKSKRKN